MDISGLITEFRIRGLDQRRIDSALKCLVHVQFVQDLTNAERGGVLVKDVLDSYPLEVTQVASELYLEKLTMWGVDVFRVKWGYESAALSAARRLWEDVSSRWEKFADGLDKRYLGLVLPETYEGARVVESWKNRREAEWLGAEVDGLDRKMLDMVNGVIGAGFALDLAYSYSSFGERGVDGRWTLLHKNAYETLKGRAERLPLPLANGVRLWRFFSRYDPAESDIVKLMKECGLALEEVRGQVNMFYRMGLTTSYRESQYPPFLVHEKVRNAYKQTIDGFLIPVKLWVASRDPLLPRSRSARPAQLNSF